MFDVAIIGGGPVGSRVAYRLASQGHSVVVLEKHTAIGQKACCTGIVSRQCVTQFSIPESVIYRSLNGAILTSPSGKILSVSHPQPQVSIVNRPLFDIWLAGHAASQGAEYLLGSAAKNVNVTPGAVEIEYQRAGCLQKFSASAVVLASGFNSPLVEQSGFGRSAYQVMGVQSEVETLGGDVIQVFFDQTVAPGFFAWLAPTSPGKALAGLMSRGSAGQHLREWLPVLATAGKIKTHFGQIRYAGIPLKPLKATASDRILVVGDAAGQVKPTTGGGLYFGLLCADFAADTLHQAITTGDYSLKTFSAYEKSWRLRLQSELQRQYWARRAYQLLSNRQVDHLFDFLHRNGILDSLIREEYHSFDSHSGLLLKALKVGMASQSKRLSAFLNR